MLFPVLVFLDFVDAVLDDLEGQFDFLVFHELVVVELVGELQQLVNLLLFFFLLLLRGRGPGGLLTLP